ncbi:MAG: hypothetical protein WA354_17380 [Terracidiphilus sp.]
MFEGEKYSAQTFTRYEELLATSNTETAKNKSANFAGYFARFSIVEMGRPQHSREWLQDHRNPFVKKYLPVSPLTGNICNRPICQPAENNEHVVGRGVGGIP